MTEKRYKVISDNLGEYSVLRQDNTIVCTEIQDKTIAELFCDELNEQNEQLQELNKYCTACDDTLTTIQELTYKLLTVDFKNTETKADYCHLLNEMDNKDLSFIHDCIKAINKCDLLEMDKLKKEYY